MKKEHQQEGGHWATPLMTSNTQHCPDTLLQLTGPKHIDSAIIDPPIPETIVTLVILWFNTCISIPNPAKPRAPATRGAATKGAARLLPVVAPANIKAAPVATMGKLTKKRDFYVLGDFKV